jgi:hypothetical protein
MRFHFALALLAALGLLTRSIEAADYDIPIATPTWRPRRALFWATMERQRAASRIFCVCPGFPAEIGCLASKDAAT